LNPKNKTPAVTVADGIDYVKTNKYVLFGHHFAAIAAAGPLLGPVLAAQFGYLPGALWIIVGCVLGGAVHDMVVLFASVRHNGQSLAEIAETEVGKGVGMVAAIAILFILLLTLAGLSIAVVNAMFSTPGAPSYFCDHADCLPYRGLSPRLARGDVKCEHHGVVLLLQRWWPVPLWWPTRLSRPFSPSPRIRFL
jgi:carbon starvation protein